MAIVFGLALNLFKACSPYMSASKYCLYANIHPISHNLDININYGYVLSYIANNDPMCLARTYFHEIHLFFLGCSKDKKKKPNIAIWLTKLMFDQWVPSLANDEYSSPPLPIYRSTFTLSVA